MLEVNAAVIGGWVGAIFWPFFRIGALIMVAPLFGTQVVPARVRLIFAIVLTLAVYPVLPPMPKIDLVSLPSFVIVAQQVLIGVAMGLILQVLLQVFVVAGQIAAMHMGLGFASMVDPTNGISVTVLSQFYLMLATLLFLAMDGHLVMIQVLVESFHTLPVGMGFISNNALWQLVSWGSWMFASALLMALPIVASMLIINFSLGVITRAAPQLNIFAIGFPAMLVIGLCIVWVTLNDFAPLFDRYTREALKMMAQIVVR